MKIYELLEKVYPQEWKFHKDQGHNSLVLYTDYGRGMEYSAVFIHERENHFEFYSQQAVQNGDRVEWGGEHTKRKEFYSREVLNTFLKKQGYPEVTDAQFDKLQSNDEAVLGVGEELSNFFRAEHALLNTIREESKDLETFLIKIESLIKKVIRKNNWFMSSKLRKHTVDALTKFYETGEWRKL
jgi:hypothetical protein